jgi:hypothetical protein
LELSEIIMEINNLGRGSATPGVRQNSASRLPLLARPCRGCLGSIAKRRPELKAALARPHSMTCRTFGDSLAREAPRSAERRSALVLKQAFSASSGLGLEGLIIFHRKERRQRRVVSSSFSLFPSVEGFSFDSFFLRPALAGAVVHLSHSRNDFATSGQNRKTYGRHLVRFFCIKMHFAPVFRASAKIRFATCTESINYKGAKNQPFI